MPPGHTTPPAHTPPPTPRFFRTAAAFRAWLERHHARERELWVGYYKASSRRTGMTYREAVDEALCFGWIDGLTRGMDEERYMQRFTPRKKDSTWSVANIKRVEELTAERRMHPVGRAVFDNRDRRKTSLYSFEQGQVRLAPAFEKRLAADRAARESFESQPPSYRRVATWWVMSAKKEQTRERRFATLLADSAAGRRIAAATPGARSKPAPER
jgi:uncharacterized protein YdeI (YjbR/CyaY-like superfamily)